MPHQKLANPAAAQQEKITQLGAQVERLRQSLEDTERRLDDMTLARAAMESERDNMRRARDERSEILDAVVERVGASRYAEIVEELDHILRSWENELTARKNSETRGAKNYGDLMDARAALDITRQSRARLVAAVRDLKEDDRTWSKHSFTETLMARDEAERERDEARKESAARGLALATLCDMLLPDDATDRSDDALVRAVGEMKALQDSLHSFAGVQFLLQQILDESYFPNTIVCSDNPAADVGAQLTAAARKVLELRGDVSELLELFKRQSIRSFICGANWFSLKEVGDALDGYDRELAALHANERFPFVNEDWRENDDVLIRYYEVVRHYAAQIVGAETTNGENPSSQNRD